MTEKTDDRPGTSSPQQSSRFSTVMFITMFPAVLIPISGLLLAASISGRISQPEDSVTASIHQFAFQTFAWIYLASIATNQCLSLAKRKDRSKNLMQARRVPLWQFLLLAASIGWLYSAATVGTITTGIEILSDLAVASASTVIFLLTLVEDASATARRNERLKFKREAKSLFSPSRSHRRAVSVILVAIVITCGAAALSVYVGVNQQVVVEHHNCRINGDSLNANGETTVYTDNCGTFEITGGERAYKAIELESNYDITSQGYVYPFASLPTSRAISLKLIN